MAVPAAIVLEEPFRAAIDTGSTLTKIVVAFLVVGLGEEALKLLVVYITAYRRAEFSEGRRWNDIRHHGGSRIRGS